MKEMRRLLNAGLAKGKSEVVKARLAMLDESLKQFESYMSMRTDLAEGKFATLAERGEAWVAKEHALAEQYRPQFAFTCRMYRSRGKATIWGSDNGVDFFALWYQKTYDDGSRIARDFTVLTTPPLRRWQYTPDKEKQGEALGYAKPAFDAKAWKTTDTAVDSWSALGFHNYYGRMWYRATAKLPPVAAGKKTYLWFAGNDGSLKVFVNGTPVPYVDAKGAQHEEFVGYSVPASFDISSALSSGEDAQITVLCERLEANEIGSGGLLGPVVVYREK
jgi:hypothetical protein